ncbi:DUF1810 domain-containing protein (plasmid) [Azospirillum humicireducens]|uniref:DUF1810 domain-containing protein n=1 Tax=Azospirillum humicireducens TaxID=1226968 RepID=A0A2R4VTF1_9PROT|nr:DUF1810 domain-containing protein [Azospirillum humicireducens]AWB07728.1 DUF1810 domain-containing protein [Azospirillum humicireducens]
MRTDDPYDLQRFLNAQAPVFATALDELRGGHKRSHWMWFVFPQMRGLGRSPAAGVYGIASLAEAQAYLAHPALGPRLEQATRAVMEVHGRTLHEIFGSPDDMKFRSSITLFALATGQADSPYDKALARWCDSRMDDATVRLAGAPPLPPPA